MAHIPFGVDISKYTPGKSKYPNSLFYIGALDWLPNVQGIDWFLKNVWANILAKFPDTQFHIGGRNMPDSLRNGNYPNVVFHGEVENAKAFIEDYDIMLVPLLAGSGVRIKIIEGMAMGKPIVTTSVGIEGIECRLGQDVLVADESKQFAEAVCRCLGDTIFKGDLGKHARMFIEKNGSIDQATAKLVGFYNEMILQKQ